MRQIISGLGSILKGIGQLLARVLSLRAPIPIALIVVLMIVSAVLAGAAIKRFPDVIGLRKGPEDIKRDEQALIAEVRSKIDLPSEETPTLATVTDVDKIKNQAFFSKAKNGDRVLIYSNAKKVVLYRPSESRVIEIGSVNIGDTQGVTVNGTPKFAILNGTQTAGLTQVMEEDLKQALESAEIVTKGNAQEQNYEQTILVNLSGNVEVANDIADKLSLKIEDLPSSETAPAGVDYLIIIGKDKTPATPTPTSTP